MKYLTTGQVAKELGVSPETIRTYIEQGIIPAKRLSIKTRYRILKTDLDNLLTASEVDPQGS